MIATPFVAAYLVGLVLTGWTAAHIDRRRWTLVRFLGASVFTYLAFVATVFVLMGPS